MDRRRYLRTVGIAAVGSIGAGCADLGPIGESTAISHRVTADRLQTKDDDGRWEDLLVRGVNMGMAKPGSFPEDASIAKSEYGRWLTQISEMNANVVRTYTLHPPGFYEAVAEHNADRERPLLLLQGTWIDEDIMRETGDVFDDAVVTNHDEELEHVVDAVHGNLPSSDRKAGTDGAFRADVSSYVLGYILGTEWDPAVVEGTDEAHPEIGQYDGTYVTTDGATPFEHWLAARLDNVATYEHDNYDTLRPLSVTNWPPTDHIDQPTDPEEFENEASVTLDHVHSADAFTPGLFATYHVYPYFPPFMNHDPDYVEYTTEDGEESSFRGFLEHLLAESDYPVLVGEFGLPSSRGMSQTQVHGFDQGNLTEREQGESNAELYEQIVDSGSLGGVVFTWQDEWFKRTWNTAEYMNPGRRPFWSDRQTSEQAYGLLRFDPRTEGDTAMTTSGDPSEWDDATELYAADDTDFDADSLVSLDDGYDGSRTLTGLDATVDPGYLHLRLTYEDLGSAVDWERTNTLVLLDVKPDQGNTTIPFETDLATNTGVDFLVHLAGPDDSRVLVDSYYDVFYYLYGEVHEMVPDVEDASERDNGEFHRIELALSREMYIESLDETVEFESYETGDLRYGTADSESEDYDSLTDVCVTPAENTVEIRLPWLLLNVRDPSRREVVGDVWEEGLSEGQFPGEFVETISISAVTFAPDDEDATDLDSAVNITDSLSPIDGDELLFDSSSEFTWDTWEEPTYEERLKRSYYEMQDAFDEL